MLHIPNREALRKALDIYYPPMRRFIVHTLSRVPGEQAEDLISDSLIDESYQKFQVAISDPKTNPIEAIEPLSIPHIINRNWNHFKREFKPYENAVRNLSYIIKDARNAEVHGDPESDMETLEVQARLTDIAKVLGLINALDEQRAVEQIRNQLIVASTPYTDTTEKSIKPVVPQAPEPTVPTATELPQESVDMWPLPTDVPLPSQPRLNASRPSDMDQAIISQRTALIAVYNATNGQSWINNHNWLSDKKLVEWHGITTDDSGNITELDLSNNRLSGGIPSDLAHLTNLEFLDLSDNELGGEIPIELSHLSKLGFLSLVGNTLTGHIPHGLQDISENDLADLGLPIGEPKVTVPVESIQAVNQRSQLDLSSLNEQQHKAVTHTDGPLLIFAGPGTGKTRVITYRVAHLIESGVPPWEILAVTFTNKAAAEIRKRIKTLVGGEANKMNIGTIHSQALYILRRNIQRLEREPDFKVYRPDDQRRLIKDIAQQKRINTNGMNEDVIRNEISRAKNDLLDDKAYAKRGVGYDSRVKKQTVVRTVARVYRSYQMMLEKENGVDFGDMLLLCLRIFREFPEDLAFYQERYRYILVDEYQDINYADYEFIRELGNIHGNICVVGDDDQNIYSWRGSSVRYIRDFEREFRDPTVVRLERNYRSTENILRCASEVISKLVDRVDKKLWTVRKDGELPAVIEAHDEEDEALQVAKLLQDLRSEGFAYNDIAVIYRRNNQSECFERRFSRMKVPYILVNDEGYFERPEVTNTLAYLRAVDSPQDTDSLEQIASLWHHGLSADTLRALDQQARSKKISQGELVRRLAQRQEDDQDSLYKFGQLLLRLDSLADTLPVSQLIDEIITKSGYSRVLENDTLRAKERWENIDSIRDMASKHDHLGPRQSLANFLIEAKQRSTENNPSDDPETVALLTAHSAKGLEFRSVIIVGFEDHVFPSFHSLSDPQNLAEERRLAYVAITRAQDRLYFTHAHHRTSEHTPRQYPSRYLREIPKELLTYRRQLKPSLDTKLPRTTKYTYDNGQHVRHRAFGDGRIISSKFTGFGEEVVVKFEDGTIRRLDVRTAKLTLLH